MIQTYTISRLNSATWRLVGIYQYFGHILLLMCRNCYYRICGQN